MCAMDDRDRALYRLREGTNYLSAREAGTRERVERELEAALDALSAIPTGITLFIIVISSCAKTQSMTLRGFAVVELRS